MMHKKDVQFCFDVSVENLKEFAKSSGSDVLIHSSIGKLYAYGNVLGKSPNEVSSIIDSIYLGKAV